MASDTPSASSWQLWAALGGIATVALLVKALFQLNHALRLPPGPRPLPILGNALDLPRSNNGASWLALSRNYGDIVYLNILGQPVLTVNSLRHAFELLDKKSLNMSHRPDSVMAKLFGMDQLFVLMPYGRTWREHRRAFHKTFGLDSIRQWRSTELKAARKLLCRLLESPKDFVAHLNSAVTETIMRVVYGIELTDGEGHHEYFSMIQTMVTVSEGLLGASAQVMEAFPILRLLPTWLPGMQAKRYAVAKKGEIDAIAAKLYSLSTTTTANGVIKDSMVTRILADADTEDLHAPELKPMCHYATATSLLGGVETTNSTMEAFFLAMAMHPEVQKKAQQELDLIVGSHRLPEFSDLDSLPYIQAIVKEIQRWHITLPLGLPHVAGEDDEYLGYDLPAGTIINVNIWAISRDPDEYPDSEAFIPERFMPDGGKLPARGPAEYVFGFGRRVCPGRYFGQASLLIFCATILHVLDIRPPVDEHGVPVKIEYRATDGTVSHVRGYEYIIEPRLGSSRAGLLVREISHDL